MCLPHTCLNMRVQQRHCNFAALCPCRPLLLTVCVDLSMPRARQKICAQPVHLHCPAGPSTRIGAVAACTSANDLLHLLEARAYSVSFDRGTGLLVSPLRGGTGILLFRLMDFILRHRLTTAHNRTVICPCRIIVVQCRWCSYSVRLTVNGRNTLSSLQEQRLVTSTRCAG